MRDGATGPTSGFRLPDVGSDLHADDLVRIPHHAALRIALLDRVDVFHARNDLAEQRILAVEERCRREADEELAVGAVGIGGARHADAAADEWRLVELGLELLARATGAGAGRVAGLGHEAGYDAV